MSEKEKRCFVYLLHCGDDSFYCGWSNDVLSRIRAHQNGNGAKYTRSHQPVEVVYLEECPDASSALRREAALKKCSHEEKLHLVTVSKRQTLSYLKELAFPEE